jgi:hypothetical protein
MNSLFRLFRRKRDCRDFGRRVGRELLKAAHVMAPRIAGASKRNIGDDDAFTALAVLAKFSFEMIAETRGLTIAQGAVLFRGVSEIIDPAIGEALHVALTEAGALCVRAGRTIQTGLLLNVNREDDPRILATKLLESLDSKWRSASVPDEVVLLFDHFFRGATKATNQALSGVSFREPQSLVEEVLLR